MFLKVCCGIERGRDGQIVPAKRRHEFLEGVRTRHASRVCKLWIKIGNIYAEGRSVLVSVDEVRVKIPGELIGSVGDCRGRKTKKWCATY